LFFAESGIVMRRDPLPFFDSPLLGCVTANIAAFIAAADTAAGGATAAGAAAAATDSESVDANDSGGRMSAGKGTLEIPALSMLTSMAAVAAEAAQAASGAGSWVGSGIRGGESDCGGHGSDCSNDAGSGRNSCPLECKASLTRFGAGRTVPGPRRECGGGGSGGGGGSDGGGGSVEEVEDEACWKKAPGGTGRTVARSAATRGSSSSSF
jgi:hypothetical protein